MSDAWWARNIRSIINRCDITAQIIDITVSYILLQLIILYGIINIFELNLMTND